MDRAFMDEGFEVVPGCEIDPDQRMLHAQLCGGEVMCHDLADLPGLVRAGEFEGLIGGPPCQSLTKLRAMRRPKYPDLTEPAARVLEQVRPEWFVLENVSPLAVEGAEHVSLNAMHFGDPPQSRLRWFTYRGLDAPAPARRGSVDDLMAYPVVAGRIYGPKRGARLQGYPAAAGLKAPCVVLQKGLANAVHYDLARAWARQAKATAAGGGK